MPSRLSKWGNSMGIRLPSYITERMGLCAGDALYITMAENVILIRPVKPAVIPAGYAGLTQAIIPAEPPKIAVTTPDVVLTMASLGIMPLGVRWKTSRIM